MKRFLTLSFISLFLAIPVYAQDDAVPVPADVTDAAPFVPAVETDSPEPDSALMLQPAAPAVPAAETGAETPNSDATPALTPEQMAQELCSPMDYKSPGSSVHGILQARILEWVPFPSPHPF